MQNRPINNSEPRIRAADINQINNVNQAARGVQALSNTEECPATLKTATFTTAVFATLVSVGLGFALFFALSIPLVPITLGVLALTAIITTVGLMIARSLSDYCCKKTPDPSSLPQTVIQTPRQTEEFRFDFRDHAQAGGRGPRAYLNDGYEGGDDYEDYILKRKDKDKGFLDLPPYIPPEDSGYAGVARNIKAKDRDPHPPRLPIIERSLPHSPKSQFPYDHRARSSRISVPYPGTKAPKRADPYSQGKTKPAYIPMPLPEDCGYATIRRSPMLPRSERFITFQGPPESRSPSLKRQPIKVPSPVPPPSAEPSSEAPPHAALSPKQPPAGGIPLAKVTASTLVRKKSELKDKGKPTDRLSDLLKRQRLTTPESRDQKRSPEPPQAALKPSFARDYYAKLNIPEPPVGPAPSAPKPAKAKQDALSIPPPPPPSSQPAAKAPQDKHPLPPPTAPKPKLTRDQLERLKIPPPPAGPPPPPPRGGSRLPAPTKGGPQNEVMEELKTKFHRAK